MYTEKGFWDSPKTYHMNFRRKEMKVTNWFKKGLCFALSFAMIIGTVTTSYAEEVVESTEVVETTETVEVVEATEVVEVIENVEEQITDVIVSVTLGEEALAEKAEELVGEVVKTDDVVTEVEDIITDAEENIDEVLSTETTDVATGEMDNVDTNIDNMNGIVTDVEDKYADAEFTTSEEAKAAVDEITAKQEELNVEYEKATAELDNAKANLDAAQAEYEAALAISEEAAAEAAAKVEAAKAELEAAESVAEKTNNAVIKLQEVLDKATEYVDKAETDVNDALVDAETKLEESKENLSNAVENLETENEEFKAAVVDFEDKYNNLVDSAERFYEAVQNAQATQEELDALYAEYEAAQQAYADAEAALEAEEARLGVTYEESQEQMADFKQAVDDANLAVADAEKLVAEAKDEADKAYAEYESTYETDEAKEYLAGLETNKDILASADSTEEEKKSATKEVAKLVIENEIQKELETLYGDLECICVNAGEESAYGKCEDTAFFVLVDKDGTVRGMYGYDCNKVVDDNGNENPVVEVYFMDRTDAKDEIVYKNENCEIKIENGSYTITTGEGETVNVYRNNEEGKDTYYTKEESKTQWVDDTSKSPVSVQLADIPVISNIPGASKYLESEVKSNEDGTLYVTILGQNVEIREDEGEYYYVYIKAVTEKQQVGTIFGKPIYIDVKIGEEEVLYKVKASYSQKEQIVYNGTSYDVSEDKSYAVDANGNRVEIISTIDENGNDIYLVKNNVEYILKTDEDAIITRGNEEGSTSNTFANEKADAYAGYETLKNDYVQKNDTYNQKVEEYNTAVDAYNAKEEEFATLVEANGNAADAKDYADEKDLGTLANLPTNVVEIVEVFEIESFDDVNDLADFSTAISNASSSIEAAQNASGFAAVTAWASAAKELYNVIDLIPSVDIELSYDDLLEALTDKESFKHEYFMAWYAALEAKVNVVTTGIAVVDAASQTITAGMNVVATGSDLKDAAIEAALAEIETALLTGAAGTLGVASQILATSDELVAKISAKVDALQVETQEAYDAVVAAQETLNKLELTAPKAEELEVAKETLEAATTRYTELVEELAATKTSLETAQTYKEAAQAQYDVLYAAENTPVVPSTPDVDVDTDDVETTPSIETVIVATTNAASTTVSTPVEEVVEIVEEETPLAAEEATEVVEEVEIVEEETPLAAGAEETAQMNFWWLLLLLLIPAGYVAYRYTKKKTA